MSGCVIRVCVMRVCVMRGCVMRRCVMSECVMSGFVHLVSESECLCIASTSALISLMIDFNRSFSSINGAAEAAGATTALPWVP